MSRLHLLQPVAPSAGSSMSSSWTPDRKSTPPVFGRMPFTHMALGASSCCPLSTPHPELPEGVRAASLAQLFLPGAQSRFPRAQQNQPFGAGPSGWLLDLNHQSKGRGGYGTGSGLRETGRLHRGLGPQSSRTGVLSGGAPCTVPAPHHLGRQAVQGQELDRSSAEEGFTQGHGMSLWHRQEQLELCLVSLPTSPRLTEISAGKHCSECPVQPCTLLGETEAR